MGDTGRGSIRPQERMDWYLVISWVNCGEIFLVWWVISTVHSTDLRRRISYRNFVSTLTLWCKPPHPTSPTWTLGRYRTISQLMHGQHIDVERIWFNGNNQYGTTRVHGLQGDDTAKCVKNFGDPMTRALGAGLIFCVFLWSPGLPLVFVLTHTYLPRCESTCLAHIISWLFLVYIIHLFATACKAFLLRTSGSDGRCYHTHPLYYDIL